MMIRIRVLCAVCAMALVSGQSLQSQPPGAAKLVRIFGRVAFPVEQRQRAATAVWMAEVVPAGLTKPVLALTDAQGRFRFDALAGKKYRIYLRDAGEQSRKTVETTGGADVAVGNILIQRCPDPWSVPVSKRNAAPVSVPSLRPEQIVIEPQNFSQGEWTGESPPAIFVEPPGCLPGPPSLDNRAYWHEWPMVSFYDSGGAVSVAAFVGRPVKSIRVIRYDPKLTPDRIKREVLRVWREMLTDASSSIGWSEMNNWRIEAIVDHDDGSHSSLLLNTGTHLRVRDRIGKYWYIRTDRADRGVAGSIR